jgi:hypothetical protein
MSIHCRVPLLFNLAVALSSFFTHESPSTTTIIATPIETKTKTPSLLYTVYM